jgi:hypothetical protein
LISYGTLTFSEVASGANNARRFLRSPVANNGSHAEHNTNEPTKLNRCVASCTVSGVAEHDSQRIDATISVAVDLVSVVSSDVTSFFEPDTLSASDISISLLFSAAENDDEHRKEPRLLCFRLCTSRTAGLSSSVNWLDYMEIYIHRLLAQTPFQGNNSTSYTNNADLRQNVLPSLPKVASEQLLSIEIVAHN